MSFPRGKKLIIDKASFIKFSPMFKHGSKWLVRIIKVILFSFKIKQVIEYNYDIDTLRLIKYERIAAF